MSRVKAKSEDGPGRGSPAFMVRFPTGMRDVVASRASQMGRSMNAEIIDAVSKHLGHENETERLRKMIRQVLAEERAG